MPSIGYVLHRLPNIVTVCGCGDLAMGLETIRNGDIFSINSFREETRLFHFVASVQLRNPKLISIEAKLNDHLI